LRRSRPAILLAVATAAVTAAPALGKEGVEATLAAPIPLDAATGDEITVAWSLASVDEQGNRTPFGAQGVYVQLVGASGGEATTGFAPADGGRTGEYEAVVVVPPGGIKGIVIGLGGTSSGPSGSSRSDVLFPITNNPLPAVNKPAVTPTPPPVAQGEGGSSAPWIAALTLVVLLGLGSLGHLVRRRRHAAAAG
jgi:hypothetical protein